jgi:hypothetical protein
MRSSREARAAQAMGSCFLLQIGYCGQVLTSWHHPHAWAVWRLHVGMLAAQTGVLAMGSCPPVHEMHSSYLPVDRGAICCFTLTAWPPTAFCLISWALNSVRMAACWLCMHSSVASTLLRQPLRRTLAPGLSHVRVVSTVIVRFPGPGPT